MRRETEPVAVYVRSHGELGDVMLGNGLQPDGLPDAGDGGVPDAVGIQYLLPAGLRSTVGGIPNGDDDLLFSLAL